MSANVDAEIEQRAEAIAARPYTFTVVQGDDGLWTARVLEVPGVFGEGDDPSEAVASARDGLEDVVLSLLEEGREVPEPFETRSWSGDLRVRLTPTLHQRAATLAAEEGVSLNRWLSAAVALAGSARPDGRAEAAAKFVAEAPGDYRQKRGSRQRTARGAAKRSQ